MLGLSNNLIDDMIVLTILTKHTVHKQDMSCFNIRLTDSAKSILLSFEKFIKKNYVFLDE